MDFQQEGTMEGMREHTPQGDLIFALDIGTRSIIGIVGEQKKDVFQVLDMEYMEHTNRAMVDGQIEDIQEVSRVAGIVRDRLEQKLGVKLESVSVAAAGRALKTCKTFYEQELDSSSPIDSQLIFEMELKAIEQAYEAIHANTGEDTPLEFCCVGYSVIRYHLDDYPISVLLGHKGKKARVEMIATFLPNEVVDSLYAAMQGIGLQISSLTLEPIAAMNAVIPNELRMLNLALVDIGAGTSDIAISKDGSVIAYTMATVAGDEVTETIVREYLVDFQTAEKIKASLSLPLDQITYKDILGFEYTLSKDAVFEQIAPVFEQLSGTIAQKILEINEQSPSAVFLVGGGSKLPTLCGALSEKLGLDDKKVVVGGNNYIKRIAAAQADISGPEFVTPMGIAITAAGTSRQEGLTVTLNDRKLRLFKTFNATVMDVLLMSGYKNTQILGRGGKSLSFLLCGEKRTIRGGYPVMAQITVNGQPAGITTPVRSGDEITMVPATQGEDAVLSAGMLAGSEDTCWVTLNGERVPLQGRLLINGVPVQDDYMICEMDQVEVEGTERLWNFCRRMQISLQGFDVSYNGEVCMDNPMLARGDVLQLVPHESKPVQTIPEPVSEPIEMVPAKPVTTSPALQIDLNGQSVLLPAKEDGTPYLFVDMLNLVEIDPTKPQGDIVLRVNGQEASYVQPICHHDQIEIYWERQPAII